MEKNKLNQSTTGILVGIGVGVGVALAVSLDNLAIGIGVGLLFVAGAVVRARK